MAQMEFCSKKIQWNIFHSPCPPSSQFPLPSKKKKKNRYWLGLDSSVHKRKLRYHCLRQRHSKTSVGLMLVWQFHAVIGDLGFCRFVCRFISWSDSQWPVLVHTDYQCLKVETGAIANQHAELAWRLCILLRSLGNQAGRQRGPFLSRWSRQLCWAWCPCAHGEFLSPLWHISNHLECLGSGGRVCPLQGCAWEWWWFIVLSPPCWWQSPFSPPFFMGAVLPGPGWKGWAGASVSCRYAHHPYPLASNLKAACWSHLATGVPSAISVLQGGESSQHERNSTACHELSPRRQILKGTTTWLCKLAYDDLSSALTDTSH